MSMINTNDGAPHGRQVKEVYEIHYPRLKRYFLRQFGDASVADDCIRETVCRFFDFIRGLEWREVSKYLFVYLMPVARDVCFERLAREARAAAGDEEDERPFVTVGCGAGGAIEKRLRPSRFSGYLVCGAWNSAKFSSAEL